MATFSRYKLKASVGLASSVPTENLDAKLRQLDVLATKIDAVRRSIGEWVHQTEAWLRAGVAM